MQTGIKVLQTLGIPLPAFLTEQSQQDDPNTARSCDDYLRQKCDTYNRSVGDLTGHECQDCNNRGYLGVVRDGYFLLSECRCMAIRRTKFRIKKSGLEQSLKTNTFQNFMATTPWQEAMKDSALRFLDESERQDSWFFAGGQVGSGKTHLCTAMVGELLARGLESRYMLWRDTVVKLKANIMDDVAYENMLAPLKTVPVLYLDDFLKIMRSKDGKSAQPTPAEIGIAFELLNYRYSNKNLVTIISCEHDIDALLDFDQAVGSRIYERTKRFCNVIGTDIRKNFRLK